MTKNIERRKFIKLLGAGCSAIGSTSVLSGISNMNLLGAAAGSNLPIYANTEYKAIVCIMLSGGNDSYNMLVPTDNQSYNHYAETRTNLAILKQDLLPLSALNAGSKSFGLHPKLQHIQQLFNTGKASFISNVGTLIEPTTLSNYNNEKNLPRGLFSHSDQNKHWQTSLPQDRDALGWGGRLADVMQTINANQNISMNISLNGVNTFQQGDTVSEYAIEPSNSGSVLITGSAKSNFYETLKRQTLDSMLEREYQNILENAYSKTVLGSQNNSLEFAAAIANGQPLNTNFPTDPFAERLNMIAKTIAAKDRLNVKRQTFFINLGGFDNHDNVLQDHASLMERFDQGIHAFYESMEELGLSSQVLTFTMSDFARKLVSNGDGSDHAWGGNCLVLGGNIKGRRIYGDYPELYLGSPLDIGSGRFIPSTSCDEYFAELALWFGASGSDLEWILPNLSNFWSYRTSTNLPIGFTNS